MESKTKLSYTALAAFAVMSLGITTTLAYAEPQDKDNDKKMSICHEGPNGEHMHMITISEHAVEAHAEHHTDNVAC